MILFLYIEEFWIVFFRIIFYSLLRSPFALMTYHNELQSNSKKNILVLVLENKIVGKKQKNKKKPEKLIWLLYPCKFSIVDEVMSSALNFHIKIFFIAFFSQQKVIKAFQIDADYFCSSFLAWARSSKLKQHRLFPTGLKLSYFDNKL